jgi:hypothetical protein
MLMLKIPDDSQQNKLFHDKLKLMAVVTKIL